MKKHEKQSQRTYHSNRCEHCFLDSIHHVNNQSMQLRIAVIASGRNCHQYVESFIQSLREQTDQMFMTFLVDDGSDTPLFQGIEDSHVHFTRFPNRTGAFSARGWQLRKHI